MFIVSCEPALYIRSASKFGALAPDLLAERGRLLDVPSINMPLPMNHAATLGLGGSFGEPAIDMSALTGLNAVLCDGSLAQRKTPVFRFS
jgi:hypothetical protein